MTLTSFLIIQIGPVILPNILNGQGYLEHLQNALPGLIENLNLPQEIQENIIFMQDGAAPHWAVRVRDHLNQVYAGRWIGRGGPIPWPARSPDLNPCDFYLWSKIKSTVYRGNMMIREEALIAIRQTFQELPALQVRNATMAVERRLQECIRRQGQHFEQYLH